MDRRTSGDWQSSGLPWEAAEQPAPLDEYMAQRVEWTPVMLASKLRAGISQHEGAGAGAASLARYASDGSALDGFNSPVNASPTKSASVSPTPAMRERSHHKPALLLSPDSDRRGTSSRSARGAAGMPPTIGPPFGLTIDAGSEEDTYRSNAGGGPGGGPSGLTIGGHGGAGHGFARSRELAVAVPRAISRPSSGGPSLIVGSRPSSAASSSCASSSRPGSASFVLGHGGVTPGGTRPISQRRMVAEYDGIISKVYFCDEGGGKVLLGAELCAKDLEALQYEGVSHVINCAGLACDNFFPSHFSYLKLNLQDTAREDISAAFYDALDFIDAAIRPPSNGTVYVHCQHGVSRSSTMVIAYLMWRQQLTYDEALDLVRTARPTINPNIGFACALLQWGSSISEPPKSLQVWSAQANTQAVGDVSSLAMRPVLLPTALLPALRGVSVSDDELRSEAEVKACREEVRHELRKHGALVLHMGNAAACWVAAGGVPDGALAEADKLISRLIKYHGLPEAYARCGAEAEGGESEAFWSAIAAPPPTPAPPLPDLPAAFRDVSMEDAPPSDYHSGMLPPPPQTAARSALGQKRGFGPPTHTTLGFGPASGSAADASGGARPFVVPSIITPGSTDRSYGSASSDRAGGGGGPTAGSSMNASMNSAMLSSFGSSTAALSPSIHGPSGLRSHRTAAGLGEAMVLAVLQTVASELLLLVQHTFDLIQPSEEQPGGSGGAARGGGAAGGDGEGESHEILHPSALLTACQELLLARPESADEENSLVAELSELLSELAPHLNHTPALTALGEALQEFLGKLPAARGEELLQAEEVMLRAIARAGSDAEEADSS